MQYKSKYILYFLAIIFFISIGLVIIISHSQGRDDKNTTLISRKILFDNPDYANVNLSPDGKWLSYLSPANGQLNIWMKNLQTKELRTLTNYADRGIREHFWSYDNQNILYLRDTNGDENWKLYKLDIKTGNSALLTPEHNVQAVCMAQSYLYPNTIIVGLNDRDARYRDLYTVNLQTGKRKLILQNNEFNGFVFDKNLTIKLAYKIGQKGEVIYVKPAGKAKWKHFRTVSLEDSQTTSPISFDPSREWMYWLDSEDTDKSNFVKVNFKTKESKILFKGNKADINYYWIDTFTDEVLAIGETYHKQNIVPLKADIKTDFNILKTIGLGHFYVISSSLNNRKWIVMFCNDDKPNAYYLFDRKTKKAEFLFYNKKLLVDLPLVKMQPVEIKSRDGLTLVSYLSLPKNRKDNTPLPMVLYVHGGPVGIRDDWGYNPYHQWLANRGYAVLSVNYRGSGGFGKRFIKLSYGEWGGKMHNDLIDAVNWAIKEKIADPKKIAIYGGSYGGYAALVGATMTPNIFACAIAEVGISNLITDMETMPPYWRPYYEWMKIMVGGDPETKEGKAFLLTRSPITYVDKIQKPLLIAHGKNDPRVKKSESDQIVEAMRKKEIPVTYIVFPDEGHGFKCPLNKLANIAINEIFLAKHLGGKIESLKDEIKYSSMELLAGKI